ncbi:PREDICTED: transmembrane protein 225 [Galeopterus variegatus]|uniref:Transmembrane protein 225 n=1 Tax=Galeopterus variegatus TaxID=482537 RepID=A0ABM0SCP0_GALVR|nr:PREDICTED: transmembrane protein 225 [Galeopterus variegatus]
MVRMSSRNIQAMNLLFSSWAVALLVIGVIVDEWIELIPHTQKNKLGHSPWMVCCTTIWPEDNLKVIRIMMIWVFILSFFLNLILGLESTCMFPQNKYVHLIIAFISFLSGILLLCTLLLYHHNLRQGQTMYFSSYKISWVTIAAYVNVIFLVTCGILSLLQCKQYTNNCTCLNICKSAKKCKDVQQSGDPIQVTSLPEHSAVLRSIVRRHSVNSDEDALRRSQVQKRRVTWAL